MVLHFLSTEHYMLHDLIDQTNDETRCFKIDILLTNSEIAYIYTHTQIFLTFFGQGEGRITLSAGQCR